MTTACPEAGMCPRGDLCHSNEGEDLDMVLCPGCGGPVFTGVSRRGISAINFMAGIPIDICMKVRIGTRLCPGCEDAARTGKKRVPRKIPSEPVQDPRFPPEPLKITA